jgi:hypothetical protein
MCPESQLAAEFLPTLNWTRGLAGISDRVYARFGELVNYITKLMNGVLRVDGQIFEQRPACGDLFFYALFRGRPQKYRIRMT